VEVDAHLAGIAVEPEKSNVEKREQKISAKVLVFQQSQNWKSCRVAWENKQNKYFIEIIGFGIAVSYTAFRFPRNATLVMVVMVKLKTLEIANE